MSHEHISPTAWLVAYQRSLSDIPLAREVFHELETIVKQTRTAPEIESLNALKSSQMAVMWESRFKMVNHVLNAYHADQILEIAAGFSTKGLAMVNGAPVTYVELDLPEVIQKKRSIIESLIAQAKISARPNFHLVEGNALIRDDVLSATRFFTDKSVVIVNEGLLPYLNRAERTVLANNVHAVLEHFGGVWITPDIDIQLPETVNGHDHAAVLARTSKIEKLTGIDVLKNRFENEEAARAFFEQLGFRVERHSFMEIADQLVMPPQESLAKKAIERGILFVMTITGP